MIHWLKIKLSRMYFAFRLIGPEEVMENMSQQMKVIFETGTHGSFDLMYQRWNNSVDPKWPYFERK